VSESAIPLGGAVASGLVTWRLDRQVRAGHEWKRLLDIALAGAGLVVAAPIFGLAALAVKLGDGGAVFYAQERVGRAQRLYRLRKFRSMIPDAEARTGPMLATQDDPRITRVGRLLRRTACDELPQLLSILVGDMSFVGPRSMRKVFSDRFCAEVPGFAGRYAVKPGLTGLAQLFARYDTPAHQKLRFDLLYIRRASLALDVKLILASFLVTFLGRWDERRGKKLGFLHRFVTFGVPRRRARAGRS
jgi:lipopolysaccharide/colanic/teichoic acid biosynthesis glycosyltransferase